MIAALCSGVAVLTIAGALRPRPIARSAVPTISTCRARPAMTWAWLARRAGPITAAEVASWCEGLARVIRSGSTLVNALRSVEPPDGCRPVIDGVVLALDRGARLTDALAVRSTSAHLDLAVTVLRACAVNGGPAAEPLDRAASTLRGRATDAAERQTQSAQARMSAVVMTVLPVAMLALLLATSSSTRQAALTSAGLLTIGLGGILNLVGWRWMRRIVARVAT